MNYVDLGKKIRQVRRQKSMTQEQLAEKAGILAILNAARALRASKPLSSYATPFKFPLIICSPPPLTQTISIPPPSPPTTKPS